MPECKAVAFTGPSGSGKTTLIEKIAQHLTPTRDVAIIKHDPKDKAHFDREGKDSDRFFKAGADVAVVSDTRTTLFSHRTQELAGLVQLFSPFDLLLVEGLKTWPLPRIAIFRGAIDADYLPYIKAMAVDETVDLSSVAIPEHIDVLDLNDLHAIIEWIDRHAILAPKESK
jgi:molybdopterin-guanine dinucleotide biosynthesis protein B